MPSDGGAILTVMSEFPAPPKPPGPLLMRARLRSGAVGVVFPIALTLYGGIASGWSTSWIEWTVGLLVACPIVWVGIWGAMHWRYNVRTHAWEHAALAKWIDQLQRREAATRTELDQLREDFDALKKDAKTHSGEQAGKRLAALLLAQRDGQASTQQEADPRR